jgi:hypothetical protein
MAFRMPSEFLSETVANWKKADRARRNRIARRVTADPRLMGPISVRRAIDAPRSDVFDLLCDLANRPAFTEHFLREFRLERLESAGVGASARMLIAKPRLWMETVIVEADRPYRIAESGKGGRLDRIPILTAWEVVEGPASATSVVTVRFATEPAHPVDRVRELRFGERFYRRQWSAALSRLKDLVESGRPAERVAIAGGARMPVT